MKKLKINDKVKIENRYFKVVWGFWSNGTHKGKIPSLKLLTKEEIKKACQNSLFKQIKHILKVVTTFFRIKSNGGYNGLQTGD